MYNSREVIEWSKNMKPRISNTIAIIYCYISVLIFTGCKEKLIEHKTAGVSMIRLVALPEKYVGQSIVTTGFLGIEKDPMSVSARLYVSREDQILGRDDSSIVIVRSQAEIPYSFLEKAHGKYVRIQGTVMNDVEELDPSYGVTHVYVTLIEIENEPTHQS
jgi:hypothetical protein